MSIHQTIIVLFQISRMHHLILLISLSLIFWTITEIVNLQTSLDMLNNILGDFYRRDHCAFHKISSIINGYGGYTAIKQLANHSNESISSIAYELNRYSNGTCGKCNQMTSATTFESMQQWTPNMERIANIVTIICNSTKPRQRQTIIWQNWIFVHLKHRFNIYETNFFFKF